MEQIEEMEKNEWVIDLNDYEIIFPDNSIDDYVGQGWYDYDGYFVDSLKNPYIDDELVDSDFEN